MSANVQDDPGTSGDGPSSSAQFECNICLDTAKDAVISYCGHLFCWPCLHQWLETRPNRQECPVCKAGIGKDKVVPLYGRGSADKTDPRDKLPPRPQAQRPEPTNNGWNGLNFGNGFQMSFGIGAFPFGFFGTMFNVHDGRPRAPHPSTPQYEDEQTLSKVFLWLALILIFWLFLA